MDTQHRHSGNGASGAQTEAAPFRARDLQAMLRQPRHRITSPHLVQIPFLFWAVEALQPRQIMQIGLGDGLIHRSLGQALETLDHDTGCLICDLGDGAEGVSDTPQDDPTPTIRRGLPDAPPEGLDLLILAAPVTEAQADLLRSWLPRMSNRGAVLCCNADGTTALGDTHPAITGPSDAQLLLIGRAAAQGLAPLARPGGDEAQREAAETLFTRLGQAMLDAQTVVERTEDLAIVMQEADAQVHQARDSSAERLMQLTQERNTAWAELEAERAAFMQRYSDQHEAYQATLQSLHRSASWRVTKPLRGSKRLLKRLMGRG